MGQSTVKAVLIAALCLGAAFNAAYAQTAQQKSFMTSVALLNYGEKRCPKWRMNMPYIATAMKNLDIEAADWTSGGKFYSTLFDAVAEVKERFSKAKDGPFCSVLEESFGPKGSAIPDAMMRR